MQDQMTPLSTATATPLLLAGTMVTSDIGAARRFYEGFFGFETVRYAPGRMLLRDRYAKRAMEAGSDDFFVLDIMEVEEVSSPQRMLHHWGLDVISVDEVDRIHAETKARKEELGVTRLMPVSGMHGAHSFYFSDRDSNWWEIEYRLDGLDNEEFFARGDVGSDRRAAWTPPSEKPSLVDPGLEAEPVGLVANARLTHGTCEQTDLGRARDFLETVLGLRCVHHLEPAQMLAGRGAFGIFAIGLPRVRPQQVQNRWLLSVGSRNQVEAAAERARAGAVRLELMCVGALVEGEGEVSVKIQDADGNWWEVTNRQPGHYQQLFDAGDVA